MTGNANRVTHPNPLRYMPPPCEATATSGPCPFRIDALPGEFTAARYEKLADTAGAPGAEAPVGAPMFACHHTADGAPVACAGWLAVAGGDHLGVRLAIAERRLSPSALRPPDGIALFNSYDEMAVQQARGLYRPDVAATSRQAAGHYLPMVAKWAAPLVNACELDVVERGQAGDPQIGGRRA